jgi:hypothetical protein
MVGAMKLRDKFWFPAALVLTIFAAGLLLKLYLKGSL